MLFPDDYLSAGTCRDVGIPELTIRRSCCSACSFSIILLLNRVRQSADLAQKNIITVSVRQ
ncbi:hypothetical protein UA45_18120 [Morganella morganii]|uniref:Uncharacterized protein n=1 Tax=Morganella morganii TaxID=582 RepID=A0A0D8L5T0_MORMO|nr:hypothetical protein UA45_18120 [Morganella morganii]